MEDNMEYYFKNETYSNEFFAQLNTLRKSGVFCDVILVSSDGIEFPVHRAVLTAGCMYFNALFTINMLEKQQARVHLKTVPSSALSEVLDYIYSGSLRVTSESVAECIFTSSMFLLLDLTEYCWDVFVKTLDLKNCISRKILADSISSASIANTVTNFVLKNFVNLDSQSLAECPATILRDVLSCDELVVCSELEVLGILVKWILAHYFVSEQDDAITLHEDTTNISNLGEELLPLVRFKFISLTREELTAFLKSFALSKHPWLRNTVLERLQTNSGSSEARLSYREVDVVLVVGGQGESSVLNHVCAYVPSSDQWLQAAPMQHPRRRSVVHSVRTEFDSL
jgi:hypothetical protein